MDKQPSLPPSPRRVAGSESRHRPIYISLLLVLAICHFAWLAGSHISSIWAAVTDFGPHSRYSPYGRFPVPSDPFHFIPCANTSVLPSLDDSTPLESWAALFEPDPTRWSWGRASAENDSFRDPYANRGIYLCGYIDRPLNSLNHSDNRIVRIAITKYQVSGLAPVGRRLNTTRGQKSERTIILEPGGPGGSGTGEVWGQAEIVSHRYSDGQYDVLGWDPRGVNASLPSFSCYPRDSFRDRWAFFKAIHREEVASPIQHLKTFDAMNNATFNACHQIHGDFGRFIDTTFAARDLEEIRRHLGEEQITGYFVSYGTTIGVTYANMFPDRVGRLLLDGAESVMDERRLGGFAWSSVYSILDTWREGFLGECISAGPSFCALARPVHGSQTPVTLKELETRMDRLFQRLIEQPMSGYTPIGGPAIVTYSQVAFWIYTAMYSPDLWPLTAQILHDLEAGDARLALTQFENRWYKVTYTNRLESTLELPYVVLCADSYDDLPPDDGLEWWDQFWADMTKKSWISGTFRFSTVFGCRHYNTYWPSPPGVYRGDLNNTLSNPVLIISGTHDPATPLKNGKDTLEDMSVANARLIIHHGYGHISDSDPSDCTDGLGRAYILHGEVPGSKETHCYANKKPYHTRLNAM